MNDTSSRLFEESPERIANRLMQKAHNQDGLPEIAIGLTFLAVALANWLQVAFPPRSPAYMVGPFVLGLLVPAMILGSQWAIKTARRRFLVEKEGYVQLKRVSRRRSAMVATIAIVIAIVAVIAAYRGLFPPDGLILAATGIGGGALAAFAGRLPRYLAGGAIMAATGIVVALSRVALGTGFAILFGLAGALSLVSGCAVFLLFMRKPAAAGE